MISYKDQHKKIQELLKRIDNKCKNFAKQEENPYYGDLFHVIEELKEIDSFLNDKYLTKNHAK